MLVPFDLYNNYIWHSNTWGGTKFYVSATLNPKGLDLSIPKNGSPIYRVRFDLERPNSTL